VAKIEREVKGIVDRAEDQEKLNEQVVSWVRGVGGRDSVVWSKGSDDPTPAANVRRSGQLRIHNQMNSHQTVVINGTDLITLLANETRIVPVAVGTVTTQITGEAPISWFIGPQNYTQDIIIAPAARNPLNPIWYYDPATGERYRLAQ
jgi:hypothetical protein